MIILPISENMNDGKTYAYFSWASLGAWVPPLYFDSFDAFAHGFSYENATHFAPVPAAHDPALARHDYASGNPQRWVRPDYVVKTDDDSFVMLAELEARLRVELHATQEEHNGTRDTPSSSQSAASSAGRSTSATSGSEPVQAMVSSTQSPVTSPSVPDAGSNTDPLIFWGYLVKNRFMAGELYALSWSLVDWIAHDPQVAEMKRGAEDKQTSKWMRLHPRADEVRWASERCWIYDHPRAGTVYAASSAPLFCMTLTIYLARIGTRTDSSIHLRRGECSGASWMTLRASRPRRLLRRQLVPSSRPSAPMHRFRRTGHAQRSPSSARAITRHYHI